MHDAIICKHCRAKIRGTIEYRKYLVPIVLAAIVAFISVTLHGGYSIFGYMFAFGMPLLWAILYIRRPSVVATLLNIAEVFVAALVIYFLFVSDIILMLISICGVVYSVYLRRLKLSLVDGLSN